MWTHIVIGRNSATYPIYFIQLMFKLKVYIEKNKIRFLQILNYENVKYIKKQEIFSFNILFLVPFNMEGSKAKWPNSNAISIAVMPLSL